MTKKVLVIVGSLREGSFNRQVAEVAAEYLREGGAEAQILDYADVPFMNQDIEYPPPAEVARVRAEVEAADGLWIVSPEYNHAIPGVLKNLLDWLSRPLAPMDFEGPTSIAGKKVTFAGIGGGGKTAYVQTQLDDLLRFIRADVLDAEGAKLAAGPEAWQNGTVKLTDEEAELLRTQAQAFLGFLG